VWNVKNKDDTSNNGATGTISEIFIKYPCNTSGMHEIKELHKRAILGMAYILRKVIM
jgi:hypothetical protein